MREGSAGGCLVFYYFWVIGGLRARAQLVAGRPARDARPLKRGIRRTGAALRQRGARRLNWLPARAASGLVISASSFPLCDDRNRGLEAVPAAESAATQVWWCSIRCALMEPGKQERL